MRRYTLTIGEREFVVDVDDLAADRFAVQVGGQSYEVTLAGDEDLPTGTISPQITLPAATGERAPADGGNGSGRRPRPAAAAAPGRAASPGGADLLKAPMPGLILAVNVAAGARVERGQELAVLEAMKMQNAIRSPRAGTVAEVFVAAGQSVGHGEPILRFEAGGA
ncbi:MAG: acetyl-CoA carboxylase biotin carboxyl carrier protein subunit [Burkholderiaceae bacterium]|nr:acetyl-CoA carboxylase biotin carboxyl carrier protein subunit [Burkholderiaceae bacterium]